MAKKKAAAKAAPKKDPAPKARQRSPGERTGLMVRIPKSTHEVLAKAADRGGISLNMLVEGLLTGCSEHLVEGRPVKRDGGVIDVRHDPGCYFVGRRGVVYRHCNLIDTGTFNDLIFDPRETDGLASHEVPTNRESDDGKPKVKGSVLFVLDHSKSPVSSWADEE